MEIQTANIPAELLQKKQWVVWKWKERGGKLTKPPYKANGGGRASSTDASTWGTFGEALRAYEDGKVDGVGFVFSENDSYCGLDFDNCRDLASDECEAEAWNWIKEIDSYTEISPSGKGYKTFLRGRLPQGGHHGGQIEVYDTGRYFTITGQRLNATSANIEPRQEELDELVRHYWPEDFDTGAEVEPETDTGNEIEDEHLITLALEADDLGKFERLWSGDFSDYASQSEADLALCCKLAFWTNRDAECIDRLFRQSGLMRKKWNRKDYRERTIKRALELTTETYKPGEESEAEQAEETKKLSYGKAILIRSEFVKLEIPSRESLLHPIIKEQSITEVYGPRGVGKTWFTKALLNAAANNESFGPWESGLQVPCLYLEGEMPAADVIDRWKQFGDPHEDEKLYIYSDGYANLIGLPKAHLGNKKWQKQIKEALLKLDIKLWAADNLSSLTSGVDEMSKTEWDPVNQFFLDLRFAGIATIFVHHSGKLGYQRGTSAREDNIDTVIKLTRPPDYSQEQGARFNTTFEKSRLPNSELHFAKPMEFHLEEESGQSTWTFKTVAAANRIQVLQMLDEGYSQKEVSETLGIHKGTVSKIRKRAIEDCFLTSKNKLTKTGYLEVYERENEPDN